MSVFLDMVFGSRSGKKTKLGKGYRLGKNGKLVKVAPNASAKAKWKGGSNKVRVARRGTPK
jgi:hypothetical protein